MLHGVLFRLMPEQAHFWGIVNHHVTKEMHFFLFVGDSFCQFLHYVYGDDKCNINQIE